MLTLAIAGNATVFSALNAFLLRPLPYPGHGSVVMVFNSMPKMGVATGGSSILDYLDRRAQAKSFADLAIVTPPSRALRYAPLPAARRSGLKMTIRPEYQRRFAQ